VQQRMLFSFHLTRRDNPNPTAASYWAESDLLLHLQVRMDDAKKADALDGFPGLCKISAKASGQYTNYLIDLFIAPSVIF